MPETLADDQTCLSGAERQRLAKLAAAMAKPVGRPSDVISLACDRHVPEPLLGRWRKIHPATRSAIAAFIGVANIEWWLTCPTVAFGRRTAVEVIEAGEVRMIDEAIERLQGR